MKYQLICVLVVALVLSAQLVHSMPAASQLLAAGDRHLIAKREADPSACDGWSEPHDRDEDDMLA